MGEAGRSVCTGMKPNTLPVLVFAGLALTGGSALANPVPADAAAARHAATTDAGPMRGPWGEALELDVRDPQRADKGWAESRGRVREQAKGAYSVIIGEVLTSRDDYGARGFSDVVSVLVREGLRGAARPGDIAEFAIPRAAASGGRAGERPVSVTGYTIVAFIGPEGDLVNGDAMYIVEGGFAWRNRRPTVMARPSADRDWLNTMDPSEDYYIVSLDEVRLAVAEVAGPQGGRRGLRRVKRG